MTGEISRMEVHPKLIHSAFPLKGVSRNHSDGGISRFAEFRHIRELFKIGPNPADKMRPEVSMNIGELLTIQRAFSEYAMRVEVCAKTGEAVAGVVRRLQQGG
jgi:hypothetical protein